MTKFKIYTLGCKVNQYDSAELKNLLILNSFKYSDSFCDLILINSCSVTKTAIAKCRRLVKRVRRENRDAKIVLFGCWPRVYDDIDVDVDLIWNGRSDNWDGLLKELGDLGFSINFLSSSFVNLKRVEERKRYFIKIQDGCNQFCSYCIIPYARGPLKSRQPEDIIREIKEAIENSYQEIVLSGIHLGLYGKDLNGRGYGLFELLKEIVSIKAKFRLRLSSIEPNELSDEIIKLFSKNKKLCPSFHIPLQSGSDKILKLMNRPYSVDFFIKKIEKIRKLIPNVAISTDLIVGFPGEDENDFMESYNLVENIKFSNVHVFSFSAHEKSPAYLMTGKLDAKTIKKRSEKMRLLSKKIGEAYQKRILEEEKLLECLVEKFCPSKSELKTQFGFNILLNSKKHKITKDSLGKIIEVSK